MLKIPYIIDLKQIPPFFAIMPFTRLWWDGGEAEKNYTASSCHFHSGSGFMGH